MNFQAINNWNDFLTPFQNVCFSSSKKSKCVQTVLTSWIQNQRSIIYIWERKTDSYTLWFLSWAFSLMQSSHFRQSHLTQILQLCTLSYQYFISVLHRVSGSYNSKWPEELEIMGPIFSIDSWSLFTIIFLLEKSECGGPWRGHQSGLVNFFSALLSEFF